MLSEIDGTNLAEDSEKFLWITLVMAHEDQASEVIFGVKASGSIRSFYKVDCSWQELAHLPFKIGESVRDKLIGMTDLTAGEEYPKRGVLDQTVGHHHLHWNLTIRTPDGPLEFACADTQTAVRD
jgi:hypothetical protein